MKTSKQNEKIEEGKCSSELTNLETPDVHNLGFRRRIVFTSA